MSELITVISRFPEHELAARRLYAHAPEFRVLCEDYETARLAFDRWKGDRERAEEFRRLGAEIEEEIHELLLGSLNTSRERLPTRDA